MKILFICMSNICRSPYCEYVFRRIVQEDEVLLQNVEWVKSSAVFNKSFRINPKSEKVLTDEGFDMEYVLSHKPTFKWGKGRQYFKDADIMRFHKKFALLSVLATGKYKAIPDPVLIKDQEKYNKAMEEIKGYLLSYADKLKNQLEK